MLLIFRVGEIRTKVQVVPLGKWGLSSVEEAFSHC